MKKTSPKTNGEAQTKCPSPPRSEIPRKPSQQTGTSKGKSSQSPTGVEKKKMHQLAKRNLRLLQDFWWVAYHDMLFVGRGAVWITMKHHDELIQIILLTVAMFLEYRLHAMSLFHN
jgi:hypothetical protein